MTVKASKPSVNGDSGEHFPLPLQEAFTVELDTGRVVEMVIAELSMLYEAGEIPDELTPIAARQLFPPAQINEREQQQRYRERLRLAKWVVGKVLRTPIPVDQLYHDEIWQIYGLANDPARALDNFRRQQARHVATLPEMQDTGPETQ